MWIRVVRSSIKKKHSQSGPVLLGTRPAKRLVVVALENTSEDEYQPPACIYGVLHARKVMIESHP